MSKIEKPNIKKRGRLFFLILLAAHISSHSEEKLNHGLCAASETILFNCELKTKNASLCFNEKTKLIQYRFGTGAKKDLIYPETPERYEYRFKLSTTPYPGGGENRIRFTNGMYSYFLYDITKTQQDIPSFNSIQTAGIVVYARDKRIANLKCENAETSITSRAFEVLQREEFSLDIDTD